MASSLQTARELAARVRFAGDRPVDPSPDPMEDSPVLRALLYQSGVELSASLTPDLWQSLVRVCERLMLPVGSVTAFVYASPEVQAHCLPAGDDGCHIRFSSGLITLLDQEEFAFVAGHEIGHFLLGHHRLFDTPDKVTAEFFIQKRSQEISVDRIGLLACASREVGLRALMKTISGLTRPHMRFDVGAFINQIRKIGEEAGGLHGETHPPILIRSRALLWFSMSDLYTRWPAPGTSGEKTRIDRLVEQDLTRFVDGAIKRGLEELRKTVLLWAITSRLVEAGSLSRAVQDRLRVLFDARTVDGLRRFLADAPVATLKEIVTEKLAAACAALKARAPLSFAQTIAAVEREAEIFAKDLPRKSRPAGSQNSRSDGGGA